MLGTLSLLIDLVVVILCFGLIVFVHELGHFVAARWAGIRVLAFAIGFGPAAFSYRTGLGWRRGSSEGEFTDLRRAAAGEAGEERERARGVLSRASWTEYRFNWLPFGGYVKMLGQEDFHPDRVSHEPDSYQSARPWKRMVVISAGVVCNIVVAALLFVIVFMVGLKTEPAAVGSVVPGSPASKAAALNPEEAGVARAGLRPGDRILSINGRAPNSFNDLVLASAMARRGRPVALAVRRDGAAAPLRFEITPEPGPLSKLLELGIEPLRSARLFDVSTEAERENWRQRVSEIGLRGLEPGSLLVRAGEIAPVQSAHDLEAAVGASRGLPVEVEFQTSRGERVRGALTPRAELETGLVPRGPATVAPVEHLLGLTPVMTVAEVADRGREQGLRDGDVIIRLGTLEYPGLAEGMGEIRSSAGRRIPMTVLRGEAPGEPAREVDLRPLVSGKGTIGFFPGDTADTDTLLSMPPATLIALESGGEEEAPPARGVFDRPGMRILRVDGREAGSLREVREALRQATESALAAGAGASVPVTVSSPIGGERTINWDLPPAAVARLHALGWQSPLSLGAFEPEQTRLVADGPVDAVVMGVKETHRVMLSTYVTFVRLFEGSVKVEHLKGPVGIAHLGTRIAQRGTIWLMFFMALVSVNLAVVNFLPLPIVDGGQFLFLLIEQARGKPAPMGLQNAASMAGMALIVAMFLIVTFNDIRGLFGG